MAKKQKRASKPRQRTVARSAFRNTEPSSIDKALMENFVSIQRVMVNLSVKIDNLTGQISKLLDLFEISAKALAEKKGIAIPVFMKGPKRNRVTLSLPVLNNAHNIIFLVSGNSKAGILQTVLEDKDKGCLYPAGMINPAHGTLTWLIDRAAASRLTNI